MNDLKIVKKFHTSLTINTGAQQIKLYNNVVVKGILRWIQEILENHHLFLVDYNPNLIAGKSLDKQRIYYAYHDALFVKLPRIYNKA